MSESSGGYSLAHPVYLDVPMMLSFLAHLEGGVSTSEEAIERETGARERLLRGRAGFRLKFFTLGDTDLSTEGSAQRRDESVFESKSQRHHTAASLFNLLYEYLVEDKQLIALSGPDQLTDLRVGQLVELGGQYLGNPLEDILGFVKSVVPYFLEQQQVQRDALAAAAEKAKGTRSQRSGNPAKKPAAPASPQEDLAEALQGVAAQMEDAGQAMGLRLAIRMAEDIDRVPVHDLLFRSVAGVQAVVTASSEYYSSSTNEYLRAGEFRVVGKVTRVVRDDDVINLTRRTVLGAAGSRVAQGAISSLKSGEGFNLDVPDPVVPAPAVQVLPMAIFV